MNYNDIIYGGNFHNKLKEIGYFIDIEGFYIIEEIDKGVLPNKSSYREYKHTYHSGKIVFLREESFPETVFTNSVIHCFTGPAVIMPDGTTQYFLFGNEISKQMHSDILERLANHNILK